MTIFIIDHSQVKHDPFPPFKIPTSKGKKKTRFLPQMMWRALPADPRAMVRGIQTYYLS